MPQQNPISEDIIKLVITRLESIPRNVEISIGDIGSIGGTYSIEQLIDSVRKQDELGLKMIEVQMTYLRSLNQKFAAPRV